jgi:hypothetical protein
LSQVFGFAKQSGGNVDVASTLGHGTVFTLYLPEVAPQATQYEHAPEDRPPIHDAAQCHILIVEDNLEVGRFANQILQDLGYQTTWATDAEQALALAGPDGMAFDGIFSDVLMPGITGVAMAKPAPAPSGPAGGAYLRLQRRTGRQWLRGLRVPGQSPTPPSRSRGRSPGHAQGRPYSATAT